MKFTEAQLEEFRNADFEHGIFFVEIGGHVDHLVPLSRTELAARAASSAVDNEVPVDLHVPENPAAVCSTPRDPPAEQVFPSHRR